MNKISHKHTKTLIPHNISIRHKNLKAFHLLHPFNSPRFKFQYTIISVYYQTYNQSYVFKFLTSPEFF